MSTQEHTTDGKKEEEETPREEAGNASEEENKKAKGDENSDDSGKSKEKEEKEDNSAGEFLTILDKLRKEVEEKDKKLVEYIKAYKQQTQETEKIRQRLRDDFEKKLANANADILKRLISVFDELSLALNHAEKAQDVASLAKGLEMTVKRFKNELEAVGVEQVHNEGKKFNPNYEEAISIIPVQKEEEDDCIVSVLQPGYMLKGNLLKAAQVVVGKYTPSK